MEFVGFHAALRSVASGSGERGRATLSSGAVSDLLCRERAEVVGRQSAGVN